MDDILEKAAEWSGAGNGIAIATVVKTWGSSPRQVGSQLVVRNESEFLGSVSGGCIEGAVITEALDVMESGVPRLLNFSVGDERAWEVGLTCGGSVSVLVSVPENTKLIEHLNRDRKERRPVVLVTDIETGRQDLVYQTSDVVVTDGSGGSDMLNESVVAAAREALASGESSMLEEPEARYFFHVFLPEPRLIIIGAVHVAQALSQMAEIAGYAVSIVDPRSAFATEERFPGFAALAEWPDDYFAGEAPDLSSAVVTLTHDPKIDDRALKIALQSDAFYVGALGSKKTHAKRIARLKEQGLSDDEIGRIHAPIGLDLGGRRPAEIAVAILSEIIKVRHHRGDDR